MVQQIEFQDGSVFEETHNSIVVTDSAGKRYSRDNEWEAVNPHGEWVHNGFSFKCQAYQHYAKLRDERQKKGCAIATATIGHASFVKLDDLREFRDLIVMRVPGGKSLAKHYDLVKGPVASLVARQSFLREVYLRFFILPSLWLLELRKKASQSEVVILNTMVFGIFLAGLAWTTVLSIVRRLYVRE